MGGGPAWMLRPLPCPPGPPPRPASGGGPALGAAALVGPSSRLLFKGRKEGGPAGSNLISGSFSFNLVCAGGRCFREELSAHQGRLPVPLLPSGEGGNLQC